MNVSDPASGATADGRSAALPGSLRRDLGLLDAVGIGVGAIVGAGIFVVTGIAADIAGPALLAALCIAAAAAAANAFSSAQLAARYPHAGGAYEYGHRLLHPLAGFAAGWMFLASKIAAAGTVALGLGAYLDALAPGLSPRAIAVGAVVAFTALNYFGIRQSSRANLVVVSISVGTLLLFIVAGGASVRLEHLRPFAPAGWPGLFEASALLFFAYTGYARIATLAEEVREPTRTIPRAIGLTIAGIVLLYLGVAFVAVGAAGTERLAATAAPLHAAAMTFDRPWVAPAVAFGAMAAMLGVILSQLLGLSRMAFAMGRRGDLPHRLAGVHPRHHTPGAAVLTVGALAAVVAATGTLRAAASAASFAILVYYGLANLSALRMPREARMYSPLVPAVGLVACTVLALSLSGPVILTGTVILIAGFGVRWILRHLPTPRARRAGPSSRRSPRVRR